LFEGDHLEDFLEGSESAGEGHEGVAAFPHAGFAFHHIGGDFHLMGVVGDEVAALHHFGDDSRGAGTGGFGGDGHRLHEAHVGPAVDQGMPPAANKLPQQTGIPEINLVNRIA